MKLPAIFLGHGAPTNATADNAYTRAWRELGAELQKLRRAGELRGALVLSAHWATPGAVRVAAPDRNHTIYDFHGFPPELCALRYDAPGGRRFADEVLELARLHDPGAALEPDMGLDHGAWSVLLHLFPAADLPVLQISYDPQQTLAWHLELGRALAPLRDRGVLLLGSGNIVHNLRKIQMRDGVEPWDWNERFDQQIADRIQKRDFAALTDLESLGPDAALAVPSADHYIPLLPVLGAAEPEDAITFPVEGLQHASISMRGVRVG